MAGGPDPPSQWRAAGGRGGFCHQGQMAGGECEALLEQPANRSQLDVARGERLQTARISALRV